MPFVRDVVGPVSNFARGRYSDFKMSPVESAFSAPTKMLMGWYKDAAEGDLRRSTVRSTLESVGFWGHLPARQTWITAEAIYDLMTRADWETFDPEGRSEIGLRDLVFARPPDRKARR